MVGSSEETKFSLGGKYEQLPWFVWKMPVARQAKHGTCVQDSDNGTLRLQLYSELCWPPTSELTMTGRLRLLPVSPRVCGPDNRGEFWFRRSLGLSAEALCPIHGALYRERETEYPTITSQRSHRPIMASCRLRPSNFGGRPLPGNSLL